MSAERETLQRAQHAQSLRDNPLLATLLDEIEDETIARWVSVTDGGFSERETLWQLMQSMQLLRTKLEAAIGGGALLRARQGRQQR